MLTTGKATKILESNAKIVCKFYDIHRHKTIRAKLSSVLLKSQYDTQPQNDEQILKGPQKQTRNEPLITWKGKQCAYILFWA